MSSKSARFFLNFNGESKKNPFVHSNDTRAYLEQIVQFIDQIRGFTKRTTLQAFERDIMCQYAVTYALQSISEIVRRLPDSVKESHSNIPWNEIRAAGNVYRHEYAFVSPAMLWKTITNSLNGLYKAVKEEIDRS
jgi:uncharacterized protein with HEPN domain